MDVIFHQLLVNDILKVALILASYYKIVNTYTFIEALVVKLKLYTFLRGSLI